MENILIKVNENASYPCEGYFWIINNEVVGITSEVPRYRVKWSMLGERAGIDHYTCHNCKNENV
jgi:NAD-dependent dihydropyrimidine dehydrogenase PreA subunit